MFSVLSSPSAFTVWANTWDPHLVEERVKPDFAAPHLGRDGALGFPQHLVVVESTIIQVSRLGWGPCRAGDSSLVSFLFLRSPLSEPVLYFPSKDVDTLVFFGVSAWVVPVFSPSGARGRKVPAFFS